MGDDEQIYITLSPAQVDEVVRAAAPGRTPGFATLIAAALERAGASGPLRVPGEPIGSLRSFADDERVSATGYLPTHEERRYSRSLLRGLAILTCYGPDDELLGVVEIAQRLAMSPSTAHRYVITLVEIGLLEQCPTTRKYKLPSALLR